MKKCKYIGVKEVMAQPMKAHEALQKGYKIGNSTPECNGFEVEYKDGYKRGVRQECLLKHTNVPIHSQTFFILNFQN